VGRPEQRVRPSVAAVLALQRTVGNHAVAGLLQRTDFTRGARLEIRSANAETLKGWVEELEGGAKSPSIAHVGKIARRIAHLAKAAEQQGNAAEAKELWTYKKRAERVHYKVSIRESNTLDDRYSDVAIGEAMAGHAALRGPSSANKDDKAS